MMFWKNREELTGKVRCRSSKLGAILLQVECLKIHTYPDEDNNRAPIDRVADCYWRDAKAEDLNDLGYITTAKEGDKFQLTAERAPTFNFIEE